MRATWVWAALIAALAVAPADAASRRRAKTPPPTLERQAVNDAAPPGVLGRGQSPLALKTAILLDRARFSPGALDGRGGEKLAKALKAFQAAHGLPLGGELDADTWAKLAGSSAEPVLVDYVIGPEDVKGPFLDRLPGRLEEMQGLKALSYTTVREMLAERHHMSEALLVALNRGKDFGQAGTTIVVANVAPAPPAATAQPGAAAPAKPRAARIEVGKGTRSLVALDADGKVIGYYPASIGSREKPAPTGTHEVRAVAENPTYTYNPDYAFKGVKADRKFDIAGGPNSPVGSVWIDLSAETFGIHGTSDPDKVGTAFSHGCVRLTNWDAKALAALVRKGTPVEFKE